MAGKTYFSRIGLIVISLLAITIASSAYEIYKMPAFLRFATAGGGWWSECDDADRPDVKRMGYAISPELQERLEHEFPKGTPDAKVTETLHNQGFKNAGKETCKTDSNIHGAQFDDGNTWSSIVWKIDAQKNILWIRGSVAFHSL